MPRSTRDPDILTAAIEHRTRGSSPPHVAQTIRDLPPPAGEAVPVRMRVTLHGCVGHLAVQLDGDLRMRWPGRESPTARSSPPGALAAGWASASASSGGRWPRPGRPASYPAARSGSSGATPWRPSAGRCAGPAQPPTSPPARRRARRRAKAPAGRGGEAARSGGPGGRARVPAGRRRPGPRQSRAAAPRPLRPLPGRRPARRRAAAGGRRRTAGRWALLAAGGWPATGLQSPAPSMAWERAEGSTPPRTTRGTRTLREPGSRSGQQRRGAGVTRQCRRATSRRLHHGDPPPWGARSRPRRSPGLGYIQGRSPRRCGACAREEPTLHLRPSCIN